VFTRNGLWLKGRFADRQFERILIYFHSGSILYIFLGGFPMFLEVFQNPLEFALNLKGSDTCYVCGELFANKLVKGSFEQTSKAMFSG
jgi:hypothetical protein